MLIRLLVDRAGPSGLEAAGQEIAVGEQEALRMIRAGQAEPVRRGRQPEKAVTRQKSERAVKR